LTFTPAIHSSKYPFNCTNQISVVHTTATASGIQGTSTTPPVASSVQQLPQTVSSSSAFQLPSQPTREGNVHPGTSASAIFRPNKRKCDESNDIEGS